MARWTSPDFTNGEVIVVIKLPVALIWCTLPAEARGTHPHRQPVASGARRRFEAHLARRRVVRARPVRVRAADRHPMAVVPRDPVTTKLQSGCMIA